MPLGFMRGASVLGAASPGGMYVALNLDENPITGTTNPQVSEAVCRVLGIAAEGVGEGKWQWDSSDEIARAEGERLLSQSDGEKQFTTYLCYLTGFIHEVRHFHDIMSTCLGQDLLFQTLNLYQNAPAIFAVLANELQAKAITRFPIPIQGRTDYLKILLEGCSHKQEVTKFFEKSRVVQERVDSNWVQSKPTLSGASLGTLFELSAVCAQVGFAYELFGDMGANTVFQLLSRRRESRRYLEGIHLVQELYASNLRKDTPDLSALGYVTWHALQGRKPRGGKFDNAPSPVVLWEYFLEKLTRKGAVTGDLQTLHNEFDNAGSSWGLLPLMDSVDDWHGVLNKRIESLASLSEGAEWNPVISVGLPTFRSCSATMIRLFSSIVEEPQKYHNLQVYGWSVLTGAYPAPQVILKHDGKVGFLQYRGTPVVSEEVAREIIMWESTFDLLVKGRGRGTMAFVEDYVFDILQKIEYGGSALKFWLN